MFEGISGRSDRSSSRGRALATAIGLHAAVLGGALLYAQLSTELPPAPAVEPIVHFQLPQQKNPLGKKKGSKPETPAPNTNKEHHYREHPQRPPRSMPAEPATVPHPPDELPPTSASPLTPGGDAPGEGDGDAGPASPGETSVCPAGAICTSTGEQILTITNSMQRPRANCEPPIAPPAAGQFGLEGRVVAQYVVHADGRADAVNILNSDAPPMFVEAVRAWAEHCTFTPAQVDGAPRAVAVVQAFHFLKASPGR